MEIPQMEIPQMEIPMEKPIVQSQIFADLEDSYSINSDNLQLEDEDLDSAIAEELQELQELQELIEIDTSDVSLKKQQ